MLLLISCDKETVNTSSMSPKIERVEYFGTKKGGYERVVFLLVYTANRSGYCCYWHYSDIPEWTDVENKELSFAPVIAPFWKVPGDGTYFSTIEGRYSITNSDDDYVTLERIGYPINDTSSVSRFKLYKFKKVPTDFPVQKWIDRVKSFKEK